MTTPLARSARISEEKDEADEKANEYPDGKVTRVNQRTAAGLAQRRHRPTVCATRRRSWSSAPRTAIRSSREPKALIQVVRITGHHQAEARIVEDDLSNPIMPGDKIFSIVWEAGRPEHFALAGKMDIDGDGDERPAADSRPDHRSTAASSTPRSTDDGEKTGNMTINTKYLVLGDTPGDESANLRRLQRDARRGRRSSASRTMDVDEFLEYMGYQGQERTVNLGRFAKPTDFKPRSPGGVQRDHAGQRACQGPAQAARRTALDPF